MENYKCFLMVRVNFSIIRYSISCQKEYISNANQDEIKPYIIFKKSKLEI